MSYDTLIVERDGPVLLITLNRPKALNALSATVLEELARALEAAGADVEVRTLVVTGAGDRAFVAGADISELSALTPDSARAFALRGQRVFSRLESLGKPSIAAINGFALGGGCELAMACTLRSISASCLASVALSACHASSAAAARSTCCSPAAASTRPRPSASVS
jgi:enoyl-CoA hydratase